MLGFILMALAKARVAWRDQADEALMMAYRDGEVAAFEELLSRYEQKLYHFIYRMVPHEQVAHDLLQESFLSVVRSARRYSPQAKFTTWLYTIARNQCIDHFRRAKHRRHASLDQPRGADAQGPTLLDRLSGGEPSALDRAGAAQFSAHVQRALDALPDEQREVFVMRELQNLKFKEIADIVGASEGTIKSRMRYALQSLRSALAEHAPHASGGDP